MWLEGLTQKVTATQYLGWLACFFYEMQWSRMVLKFEKQILFSS